MLGHGAGGGIGSPDLGAASEAALAERCSVALVEQPYRVAGRRSPAPARQLDQAWKAVITQLTADPFRGLPIVVGGRSMGARVACRTAAETDAIAVLCLAFPLQPPRRRTANPAPSRLDELDQLTVACLIVQGARDPFGMPPDGPNREVVKIDGDHSLKSDVNAVGVATRRWLAGILDARDRRP